MSRDNYSNVSMRRNQDYLFDLTGIDENGNPTVANPRYNGPVKWDSIFDSDGNNIDPNFFSFFKNQKMLYNSDKQTFHLSISFQICNKPYSFNSRVLFSDTVLPKHPEFSGFFLSNQNFSTKEKTIFLGFLEGLLRTNYNPELMKKLLPGLSLNFTNHFKGIFDFLLSSSPEEKQVQEKCLMRFASVDLSKPSSIQSLANDFSFGISIKTLIDENNYEEYMILPKFCDITPIPLMQLLIWHSKVFTIYSSDQNSIDGYDPKGNIVKSCELDESYPDSFYVINSSQTIQTTHQLLKATTELLTLADPENSNLTKAGSLIQKTLSNISELQKKKIDPETLSECEENIKKFRLKVEKKANSQTGKANMNYPVSAASKIIESREIPFSSEFLSPNGINMPRQIPNKPVVGSYIPPPLINQFERNPAPSNNYKIPEIPNGMIPKSMQPPMRQAYSQSAPGARRDRIITKCPSCGENLPCSLLHASCQMCNRCSFMSISRNICSECNSKISDNDKRNAIEKLVLTCDFCSKQLAATGFTRFKCDCYMCVTCNSRYKGTKKCPKH